MPVERALACARSRPNRSDVHPGHTALSPWPIAQGTPPAYGEGEVEAEELADDEPAAEALVEALAEEALAEAAAAEEMPVGPALMVRTTGALGRASVPAEGSVPVTVPDSSWLFTVLMAATV